MNPEDPETTNLSRCLVHQVSPRGGDNYWARVINGTDKVYTDTKGTMSVSITRNNRYVLTCHNPFFDRCTVPLRKLVLIHEAGHLALRHLERYIRMLTPIIDPFVRNAVKALANWAMDFAVNDAILRHEKEFKDVHRPFKENGQTFKEAIESATAFQESWDTDPKLIGKPMDRWIFLLPEEYGLPAGKSFDEYMRLMLADLPKLREKMEDLNNQIEKALKKKGGVSIKFTDGNAEVMDGESSEDGGDEGEDAEGTGSPSKKPGKKTGPGDAKTDDDDPGVPQGLHGAARDEPETFDFMREVFNKVTYGNHEFLDQIVDRMTPEEGVSAANGLKQHAKRLVRSAHEQTKRTRGFIPADVQKLVDGLLKDEQVPWNWIFQDDLAAAVCSRMIEAMVMPNLSLINEDYLEPWPGNALDMAFNVTFLSDTSGSMHDDEYARAVSEVNHLLAINKSVKLTYIECDAAMQKEQRVDNMSLPDEAELEKLRTRKGYGGTVYTPAFKRILGLDTDRDWLDPSCRPEEPHQRPDLMIVYTDGGVSLEGECFPQYHPGCPIIWLLAPGCSPCTGMTNTSPDRLIQMFPIKGEEY